MQEVCHFPVATDKKYLLISRTVLHTSILERYNFQNRVLAKKYPRTC